MRKNVQRVFNDPPRARDFQGMEDENMNLVIALVLKSYDISASDAEVAEVVVLAKKLIYSLPVLTDVLELN